MSTRCSKALGSDLNLMVTQTVLQLVSPDPCVLGLRFPSYLANIDYTSHWTQSSFHYRRDGNVVVLTEDEACSPRAPTKFPDTCDVDVIMPKGISCSLINSNRIKLSEGKPQISRPALCR